MSNDGLIIPRIYGSVSYSFSCNRDRLSFVLCNLELVNLEIKNPTFVFWEKLWLDNLVSRLTDLYLPSERVTN